MVVSIDLVFLQEHDAHFILTDLTLRRHRPELPHHLQHNSIGPFRDVTTLEYLLPFIASANPELRTLTLCVEGPQPLSLVEGHQSPDIDTDTETDTNSSDENIDPRSIPGSSKCRKTMHEKAKGQSTSEMHKVHELLIANEERRGLFEGRMVKAVEDSTAVYERTQEKFINVLMDKLN
jgi:hypothetical protein